MENCMKGRFERGDTRGRRLEVIQVTCDDGLNENIQWQWEGRRGWVEWR